MSGSSSSRYLLGLAAGVVASFGLIWAYVLARPEAFMESGFPVWEAKQSFISSCDLGEAMISGDSRAEAAVDPRGLDIPTRNISFGAETPVEGYLFARRAMSCAHPPREMVFSFAMTGFTQVSPFLWEDGTRFGFIHYDELSDVSATARRLNDPSVDAVSSRLGFGGPLRNLLYAIHFPPLYFNALLTGQLFRRSSVNRFMYEEARTGLGHLPYDHAAPQPPESNFHLLPVQDAFFQQTLALLQQRNVQSYYIAMPVSETHAHRDIDPAASKAFLAYLVGLTHRYPNFHVVTPTVVAWPDDALLDGIHLKAAYTSRFTQKFRACQDAVERQAGAVLSCDLSAGGDAGLARR